MDELVKVALVVLLLGALYPILNVVPRQHYAWAWGLQEFNFRGKTLFWGIGVLWALVGVVYPLGTWQTALAAPILLWLSGVAYALMGYD